MLEKTERKARRSTVIVESFRMTSPPNIGDSRAYLMRGKSLLQMTSDHTLAQALVDAGIATPGDAVTQALQHVLTAALGASSERVDPQMVRFRLSHNDQVRWIS